MLFWFCLSLQCFFLLLGTVFLVLQCRAEMFSHKKRFHYACMLSNLVSFVLFMILVCVKL